jgi:nicotinamidase-related amidase
VKDALLLIDVVNTFEHEDGDALLASFRERLPGFLTALSRARAAGIPVVYANDNAGRWDSDAPALVRAAVEDGRGGDVVEAVAPQRGDRFVLKPRYSAFDHTPLVIILRELEIERLLLAGAATEACVVQTAIDARELGFKVTILADACATVDEEIERLAFEYAERVVGARVDSATDVGHGPA